MGLIYTLAGALFVYSLVVLTTSKQKKETKRAIVYTAMPICAIFSGFLFERTGFIPEEYLREIIFYSLYSFVFLFFLALMVNFRGRKTNLKIVTIFALLLIVTAILHRLGYLNAIIIFLTTPRINIGDKKISFNGIIGAIVIFYLSLRLSGKFEEIVKYRLGKVPVLDTTRTGAISILIRYLIIVIGVFTALAIINIDFTSIKVLIGALGVGIGFGLREIVNNLISGFILLWDKTVVQGDLIEVQGLLGKVETVGLRTTIIRTFNNVEVIVPNTNLVNNELINYTHSDSIIRLDIPIGVSYSSDPFKVKRVLIENLSKLDGILQNPEVNLFFTGFGESSLDFEVAIWIDNPSKKKIIESEARYMIWKTLKDNDIEIPFPQRDIHIKKEKT